MPLTVGPHSLVVHRTLPREKILCSAIFFMASFRGQPQKTGNSECSAVRYFDLDRIADALLHHLAICPRYQRESFHKRGPRCLSQSASWNHACGPPA